MTSYKIWDTEIYTEDAVAANFDTEDSSLSAIWDCEIGKIRQMTSLSRIATVLYIIALRTEAVNHETVRQWPTSLNPNFRWWYQHVHIFIFRKTKCHHFFNITCPIGYNILWYWSVLLTRLRERSSQKDTDHFNIISELLWPYLFISCLNCTYPYITPFTKFIY